MLFCAYILHKLYFQCIPLKHTKRNKSTIYVLDILKKNNHFFYSNLIFKLEAFLKVPMKHLSIRVWQYWKRYHQKVPFLRKISSVNACKMAKPLKSLYLDKIYILNRRFTSDRTRLIHCLFYYIFIYSIFQYAFLCIICLLAELAVAILAVVFKDEVRWI